jgi:drug/metabolite transporter (DMT)-like permease
VSRSLKAHTLLVVVTFVWGATFVVIKDALNDASPLLFNAVRMTVAGLALLMFYRRHLTSISAGALKAGILAGIFLWIGYEFQTTGLLYTTASKSGFLTGFSVLLVPVFLAVGWRRPLNRWTMLGVLVALFGLYLMTVPIGDEGWQGASSGDLVAAFGLENMNRGDILTLGCALMFALQIILMGHAMQRHRFEQVATVEVTAAALLMLLTVPVAEKAFWVWTPRVIWAILVTALLGTSAAFTIQAWAQQFTPPTHTALIFLMEPVFAWLTSYVVLHERLGVRAGVGAILILAGIVLSELKGAAAKTSSEEPAPALVDSRANEA